MTTCEYDGTAKTYNCQREEQCDDCFMIDHQKECGWCEFYDHTTRKLEVKHDTGERKFYNILKGAVVLPEIDISQIEVKRLPSDYPKDEHGPDCLFCFVEHIADMEQKWGEPRLPTND